tara:strand:+ start:1249 stop:4905 length:3657 start_codon:yes stop_codon:yes gene_type:complete
MGNLRGKPYRGWVTKQIQRRQESLGYVDYSVKDLKYQNTKTPWIRLASTANISQYLNDGKTETNVYQKLLKNGLNPNNFLGDKAAKNYILQGGVVGIGENNELITYQGLNSTNQYYKGAYGWGGIDEKGYVPLPGIIDADLIYKSDGQFAQATVNMKCYSRSQLVLLDILYMRPGIHLLLEFGWSSYLDNKTGELRTYDTFISPALDFTLNKTGVPVDDGEDGTKPSPYKNNSKHSTILGLIENERIARSGNYEGIFGKITNFNWSFDPSDGSYNCQAKLLGHGTVIESLLININEPDSTKEFEKTVKAIEGATEALGGVNELMDVSDEDISNLKEEAVLQANLKRNRLYNILDSIYRGYINASFKGFTNNTSYGFQDFRLPQFKGLYTPDAKDLKIKNGVVGFTNITTNTENNQPVQVYIKFSVLLAIIQKYFLLYDEQSTPYFFFDMNFFDLDNDENYISNLPGQFSANPFMVATPYQNHNIKYEDAANEINESGYLEILSNLKSFTEFNLPDTTMNKIFSKAVPNYLSDKGHVAKLADVYLNIEFLKGIIANNMIPGPQTLTMTLVDFLKTVLESINSSRGGINAFKIESDATKNSVKIIDEASIRFKTEFPPTTENNELCVYNTFGVRNKQEGSIVKNIDINSTIDGNMSTTIALSLGDGANSFQGNGTGLQKWSQGINDRIYPIVNDSKVKEGPYLKLINTFVNNIKGTIGKDNIEKGSSPTGFFQSVLDDLLWRSDDVETLMNANRTYASLLNGIMVKRDELQSPTFLPFNFSMDIEGISGIRLHEYFELDDNVLPNTYDSSTLEMRTVACDHIVNGQTWTTKQRALPLPAAPPDAPFGEANPLADDSTPDLPDFNENLVDAQAEVFTITSEFPITQIYKLEETPKTQIYLHHTVSSQDIKTVIDVWSSRTDQVATQYVTNNNGEVEQVFPDENWANQLGIDASDFKAVGVKYQNLNRTALGIELCSYGPLNKIGDKYFTIYNKEFTGEVARPVGFTGEEIDNYKGYKYFEKYSDAQINNVKSIIQGWMQKYNIKFNYNYNVLFPRVIRDFKPALKGDKGIYTHNSVRSDKSDIFPQKELIEMLKSLSENMSDEALVLAQGGSYVADSMDYITTKYAPNRRAALSRAKSSATRQLIVAALGEEKARNYSGLAPVMIPDPGVSGNTAYTQFTYLNKDRDVGSSGIYAGYTCSGIFVPSGTETMMVERSSQTYN